MERNVGGTDRYMRLVLGALLLAVGVWTLAAGTAGESTLMTVLTALVIVIGAVFLVTGAVQQCPINAALGINTCQLSPESDATDAPAE
jgi:uncharacterized membrane protein HdeD (DUF308 family)